MSPPSFGDLFAAAFPTTSDEEANAMREVMAGQSQAVKNQLVREWAPLAGWHTQDVTKDGLTYTAFSRGAEGTAGRPGLSQRAERTAAGPSLQDWLSSTASPVAREFKAEYARQQARSERGNKNPPINPFSAFEQFLQLGQLDEMEGLGSTGSTSAWHATWNQTKRTHENPQSAMSMGNELPTRDPQVVDSSANYPGVTRTHQALMQLHKRRELAKAKQQQQPASS